MQAGVQVGVQQGVQQGVLLNRASQAQTACAQLSTDPPQLLTTVQTGTGLVAAAPTGGDPGESWRQRLSLRPCGVQYPWMQLHVQVLQIDSHDHDEKAPARGVACSAMARGPLGRSWGFPRWLYKR